MWEMVTFAAGLLVFMLLIHLAAHLSDIPGWIVRAVERVRARSPLEERIAILERRLSELERRRPT